METAVVAVAVDNTAPLPALRGGTDTGLSGTREGQGSRVPVFLSLPLSVSLVQ